MMIEKILGAIQDMNLENLEIDRVLLDRYDMSKPHQKVKTQAGKIIAISLPHGQSLFCGAVLHRNERRIIAVDLLPEDALRICPEGNLQWAKTAFNLGNMHHPAYLEDDCILTPYDAIIENMLKKIGVRYERCQCALTGERANAAAGHSHSHHHDHGQP